MSDAVSEFIFWYCGDLINHESRKSIEAVAFSRRVPLLIPDLDVSELDQAAFD